MASALAICRSIPICSQSYRFSIPRFAGILSKGRTPRKFERAISRRARKGAEKKEIKANGGFDFYFN